VVRDRAFLPRHPLFHVATVLYSAVHLTPFPLPSHLANGWDKLRSWHLTFKPTRQRSARLYLLLNVFSLDWNFSNVDDDDGGDGNDNDDYRRRRRADDAGNDATPHGLSCSRLTSWWLYDARAIIGWAITPP